MNPSPCDSVAFDVYVLGRMPHHWGPGPKPGSFEPFIGPVGRGFVRANLELADARELAHQHHRARVHAIVVPAQYRDEPGISCEHATTLARAAFERLAQESTDTYSELSAGEEGLLWWEFKAANITAQDAGYIPGVHRIHIDKLLARPLDQDEVDWMFRLTHG